MVAYVHQEYLCSSHPNTLKTHGDNATFEGSCQNKHEDDDASRYITDLQKIQEAKQHVNDIVGLWKSQI